MTGGGQMPFFPIIVERGEGPYLVDENGVRYLDFAESINVLGFGRPELVQAISSQASRLVHYTSMLAWNKPCLNLSKRIAALTGVPRARVVFTCSGSEANELLLDHLLQEGDVIAVRGAYHGLLTWTSFITLGKEHPNIHQIPPNTAGLHEARRLFREENISGVIVETLMVHAGILPLPEEWLRELRELAHDNSAVFVVDEVYTGLGKTGALFSYQRLGFRPDVVTLGKSLGGGLPLGAVVYDSGLLEISAPGGTSTSQGANTTACAAGSVLLDVLEREEIPSRVHDMEPIVAEVVREAAEKLGAREARGRGFIWGIDMGDPGTAGRLVERALERGVLVSTMGHRDEVVRLSPPLVVGLEEWRRAVEALY